VRADELLTAFVELGNSNPLTSDLCPP
jgi:hypothetical protein